MAGRDLSVLQKVPDVIWLPAGEVFLILVSGAVAFFSGLPLLFASIGPTAYEQAQMPHLPSSRPYNIIVGHGCGVVAGFAGLWLTGAWGAPAVNGASHLTAPRLWAALLAVLLTSLLTVFLKARQPAAMATTLLVALGGFQTMRGALAIICAVVLIAAVGEPVRRAGLRRKSTPQILPASDGPPQTA
jgi:hypothetical protein